MAGPLEFGPEIESVTQSVTVRRRAVPAAVSGSTRVGAEMFLPREAQRAFLRALLEQDGGELDLERAARSSGTEAELPRWRLEPGFVKWVEEHLDAAARLDMAVLRRKVLRRALGELDGAVEKPVALPLVAKLWPASRLGKQEDDGVRVQVSASEAFKKLAAPAPAEIDVEVEGGSE